MTPTVVATAGLDEATLAAGRALCGVAFEGAFDDTDWAHALGGVHALVHEDGRLVGHAALVGRTLWHDGRALRTGYVEAVAVDPASQGRGHGGALMRALEPELRARYELGALSATEAGAPLYARCGWRRWEGPTAVRTPDGVVRTPDDDGAVWVLERSARLAPDGELTCDFREGDVW